MAPARRSRKGQDLDERLLRSAQSVKADTDGIRLYNMARELKITPVQAVVRYFCHGRGHYAVKRDYEGLVKILTLLAECDWEYDPAVKVNEGDDITDINQRWVVWDRDRPDQTITTEIRCTEDAVERFIKPLLGETFNVASFMQRLVEQGPTEEAIAKVEEAITLRKHGGDRRSEVFQLQQQGGNRRQDQASDRSLKHGETAAYIRARLQRDHPELAEALERGEFRSARAAAIEAGIIKPVPTVRLTADIPAVATRICQHLTPEQVHSLCEALLSISNPTITS